MSFTSFNLSEDLYNNVLVIFYLLKTSSNNLQFFFREKKLFTPLVKKRFEIQTQLKIVCATEKLSIKLDFLELKLYIFNRGIEKLIISKMTIKSNGNLTSQYKV